jgi:hypothetical protein
MEYKYSTQGKLVVIACGTPIRLVPLTGQTSQTRVSPKTHAFSPTLHQKDQVTQVSLDGTVSTP